MAEAVRDIIDYLETGDKSHLREAKKNLDAVEVLIKESQKQTEIPSKKGGQR